MVGGSMVIGWVAVYIIRPGQLAIQPRSCPVGPAYAPTTCSSQPTAWPQCIIIAIIGRCLIGPGDSLAAVWCSIAAAGRGGPMAGRKPNQTPTLRELGNVNIHPLPPFGRFWFPVSFGRFWCLVVVWMLGYLAEKCFPGKSVIGAIVSAVWFSWMLGSVALFMGRSSGGGVKLGNGLTC